MEKMKWKITTPGSYEIFEYFGTARGAKAYASKNFLSFGNNVTIKSEKGHVYTRKFRQALNRFWWENWE